MEGITAICGDQTKCVWYSCSNSGGAARLACVSPNDPKRYHGTDLDSSIPDFIVWPMESVASSENIPTVTYQNVSEIWNGSFLEWLRETHVVCVVFIHIKYIYVNQVTGSVWSWFVPFWYLCICSGFILCFSDKLNWRRSPTRRTAGRTEWILLTAYHGLVLLVSWVYGQFVRGWFVSGLQYRFIALHLFASSSNLVMAKISIRRFSERILHFTRNRQAKLIWKRDCMVFMVHVW